MNNRKIFKLGVVSIISFILLMFNVAAATNNIEGKKVLFDGDSIAYGSLNQAEKDKCGTEKCVNGHYSYANFIANSYICK